MDDIRIIAHRGIRGPYTENSLASFNAAVKTKADAVEFDVQATKDGQLIVLHSMGSPKKVFGIEQKINDLTWDEIKEYRSKDDERIPTFDEVMAAIKGKPAAIDIKDITAAGLLAQRLDNLDKSKVAIIGSLYPEALERLKNKCPGDKLALGDYKHPFQAIKTAQKMKLGGITLPLYFLNPLTYRAARRAGLKVFVYQNYISFLFNWRWFVRFLWLLYPKIGIISDRADKIARY